MRFLVSSKCYGGGHTAAGALHSQHQRGALPQALSDLVMRAMAVDKAARFQTMDELRAALEKFR